MADFSLGCLKMAEFVKMALIVFRPASLISTYQNINVFISGPLFPDFPVSGIPVVCIKLSVRILA